MREQAVDEVLAHEAEEQDIKKGQPNDSETGQAALDAFKEIPEVGALLGPLLEGIQQAGLLNLESASFNKKPSKAVLTVRTTSEDPIIGEIASKSRVPVAWKVQETLTFDIDQSVGSDIVVQVSGLGTQPSAQGLALYETAMKEANIDPKACDGTDMECIKAEMNAAGKFLLNKDWGRFVNYNRIKEAPGKLSKVLVTTFGKNAIYMAINVKGEWPKIFYSMITATPLKITSFTFQSGTVYANSELDPSGDARYSEYHLLEKSSMMGEKSMKDAKATMQVAEKFARSGMAFAKMLAFGKESSREEMHNIGLTRAAEPSALQNLFSLCELNPGKGEGATEDPQCSGKQKGRVWWGSIPGESFTDKTT